MNSFAQGHTARKQPSFILIPQISSPGPASPPPPAQCCCPGLSPCPQTTVSQGKSKQPEDWPCGALHASLTAQSHSVKEVLRSPLGRGDH